MINLFSIVALFARGRHLDRHFAPLIAAIGALVITALKELWRLADRLDSRDGAFFNRRGCNAFPSSDGIYAFRRAITLGSVDALFNLGVCYREGAGVKRRRSTRQKQRI